MSNTTQYEARGASDMHQQLQMIQNVKDRILQPASSIDVVSTPFSPDSLRKNPCSCPIYPRARPEISRSRLRIPASQDYMYLCCQQEKQEETKISDGFQMTARRSSSNECASLNSWPLSDALALRFGLQASPYTVISRFLST